MATDSRQSFIHQGTKFLPSAIVIVSRPYPLHSFHSWWSAVTATKGAFPLRIVETLLYLWFRSSTFLLDIYASASASTSHVRLMFCRLENFCSDQSEVVIWVGRQNLQSSINSGTGRMIQNFLLFNKKPIDPGNWITSRLVSNLWYRNQTENGYNLKILSSSCFDGSIVARSFRHRNKRFDPCEEPFYYPLYSPTKSVYWAETIPHSNINMLDILSLHGWTMSPFLINNSLFATWVLRCIPVRIREDSTLGSRITVIFA